MKRYSLLVILLLLTCSSFAQTYIDALRFSQQDYQGTARFTSMGGAFGALGGDFTTLSLNPGGIGVYRSSEFTISPSLFNSNVDSKYMNLTAPDSRTRFAFGNIGYIGTYLTGNEEGLVGINLGVGYNRVAHFHRNTTVIRDRSTSSIMDDFADKATLEQYNPKLLWDDGRNNPFNTYSLVSDWGPILAYNTFLISDVTDKSNNLSYVTEIERIGDAMGGTNWDLVNQHRLTTESGSTGEYVFSMGGNISNKFYFGLTFGVHDLFYEKVVQYNETGVAGNKSNFNNLNYSEYFRTSGTGYNGKFGIIYRPIPSMRFGAAIHTPTFYYLTDRYYADMNSLIGRDRNNYSTPTNVYDYRLQSPLRAMGSFAYTFGQLGLISVDYEFIDYTGMRMNDSRLIGQFNDENQLITQIMRGTSNIHVGLETWMLGNIALRGGFIYNESPMKEVDLSKYTYSAGIGYRYESFFMDFAYALSSIKNFSTMYFDPKSNAYLQVTEKEYLNRFVVTLGFRF